MATTQFTITLPEDIAQALERARGDVSRSMFIRRTLEQRLKQDAQNEHPAPGSLPQLPQEIFNLEKRPKRRARRPAKTA